MGFELYYTYNGTDYKLFPFDGTENISWRNVSGTPCKSIRALSVTEEGYVIPTPGRYRITFDSTSTNTYNTNFSNAIKAIVVNNPTYLYTDSGTHTNVNEHGPRTYESYLRETYGGAGQVKVRVDCPDDLENPYITPVGEWISVDITDGNLNRQIIPGLEIQLTNFPAYYHIFDVIIGGIWISDEEQFIRVLPFGNIVKGSASNTVTLTVKNVSGVTETGTRAYVLNKALLSQDAWNNGTSAGRPIYSLFHYGGLDPVAFLSRAYQDITFDNYTAGSPSTVDIIVGSYGHDMFDESDPDTLIVEGKQLKCDGTTKYIFAQGTVYQGVGIILSDHLEEADTAEIMVNMGDSIWEIKENTATAWKDGVNGTSLGDLSDDETVSLDIRYNVGLQASVDMNPIEGVLQIVGSNSYSSIGLTAYLLDIEDSDSAASLYFRVSVLSSSVITKLGEFGITVGEAS